MRQKLDEKALEEHESIHEDIKALRSQKEQARIDAIKLEKQKEYESSVEKVKAEFAEISEKILTFYWKKVPEFQNDIISTLEAMNERFDSLSSEETELVVQFERIKEKGVRLLNIRNELVSIFNENQAKTKQVNIFPDYGVLMVNESKILSQVGRLRCFSLKWQAAQKTDFM